MPSEQNELHPHDSSVVGTLQSLVVAFVLAMTFRGFVTEGFVIPTGSMAPSLMGRHLLFRSEQTGADVAVGVDRSENVVDPRPLHGELADPLLGANYPGTVLPPGKTWTEPPVPRMGDRILVLKSLFPFNEPDRYDVVVFKNPTDPLGDSANYIKRLIGLPNEEVWLVDGDVFSRGVDEQRFQVRRKPEHVQRAVWAPIFDSDYLPRTPEIIGRPPDTWPPLHGVPFDAERRMYRIDSAAPVAMSWNHNIRQLDDWMPYNMHTPPGSRNRDRESVYVIDLRVAGTIDPQQEGLSTTLELEGRNTIYQFRIDGSEASVRLRAISEPGDWQGAAVPFQTPGRVFNLEFWHADQRMAIYIDGELIVEHEYDWNPEQRLRRATGDEQSTEIEALIDNTRRDLTDLRWRFEGAPATISRVRIDRDLYYRSGRYVAGNQIHFPKLHGRAAGTEPLALGPDHFFMCGDNSPSSLDGRYWGRPHPLIAERIDPSPSVVHRKLLMGKAWVVYFPAPYRLKENGVPIVPDFGRLRFIR